MGGMIRFQNRMNKPKISSLEKLDWNENRGDKRVKYSKS